MKADDFLDETTPSAEGFLDAALPAGPLKVKAMSGRGMGAARAPQRVSVMEGVDMPAAVAPAPAAVAPLLPPVSPQVIETPTQAARRANATDRAMQARRDREVTAAREQADQAFGGAAGQAAAAPGRRLLSGVASTMSGIAGLPQLVGSNLGKETSAALNLMAQANMPEDPGLADQVLQGAGQVGPLAGGGAVLRTALARAIGPALATEIATGTMGAVGGAQTGSQVLNDLEFRGDLTDDEKRTRALGAAAFSAITGKYADRFLLPGADKAVAGPLVAARRALVAEGGQEGLDQMGQNVATDKALMAGVPTAALVGGIVGGGTRLGGEVGGLPYQFAQALDADTQNMDAGRAPLQQPAQMVEPANAAPAPVRERVDKPSELVDRSSETQTSVVDKAAVPQLSYDPTVENPRPPVVVDPQGNAQAMSADEFLDAEATRAADEEIGLTPDVRRAQANRSEPIPEQPNPSSDLERMLVSNGWTPPPVRAAQEAAEAAAREEQRAARVAPEVEAMGQDLERVYQQDVKDGIRDRLGIDQPPAAPAASAAKPASYAQSPFIREIARQGGISAQLRRDMGVDPKRIAGSGRVTPNPYNVGGASLFRPEGLDGDRMVETLVAQGYLSQQQVDRAEDTAAGGAHELAFDLVRRELQQPGSVRPIDTASDDAGRQLDQRYRDELYQRADTAGIDTRGMTDQQVAVAVRRATARQERAAGPRSTFDERKADRIARMGQNVADAFTAQELENLPTLADPSNTSLDAAMRAMGFTEQEIADALAEETEAAVDPAGVAEDAGGREEGGDPARSADPRDEREGPDSAGSADPALTPAPRLSRPAQRTPASTADTIRTELRGRFGDLVDRLEKRGLLKIWDSAADYNQQADQSSQIEGEVQGSFDGRTSHLFGDGIEPGKAIAVFLHEVGEHANMRAMLGEKRYADLVARAHQMVEGEDPTAERADMRIPEDTPAEHRDSELLAYLIEEAASARSPSPSLRKWLAEVVAAVRAWFFQTKFGQRLESYGVKVQLTAQDIAALAERAVRFENIGNFDSAQFSKPAPKPGSAASAAGSVFGGARRAATPAPAGSPPAAPPANPASLAAPQTWNVPEPGTWDNLVRSVQNNKIDLKRVRDAIEAGTGKRLADNADAYLQEELYHGKVAARIERLQEESVRPLLEKIARAGKANGVTLDDVNTYLHARHAPERNAAMKAINPNLANNDALSGMSDADAAKVVADFTTAGKLPALQAITKDVDALIEDTRTGIVADGLEEAGTVQAWEKAYKHYVPLQRDIEGGTGKGSGFSVRGPESKRATGSNAAVVNILANIVTQAETAAIRAEKAEVGRSLLEMAQQYPNPDFWTVDIPPTKPRVNPQTGLVMRNAIDPIYQAADNVLMVKSYGREHFIVFDKGNERAMAVAKAMKNLDVQQVPKLIQYAGKGTRFIASLLTQRNPEFWFTNFARDLQGSAIQANGTDAEGLQARVIANLPGAMGGVRAVARGTGRQSSWVRNAQDLMAAGGTTGYMDQFENSTERMKDLEKEVARMQQGKADPRRLVRQMLGFIDDYNDVVENGMRLAVFQAVRDSGVSTARAASIAKNITVNFNRKGNATPLVNSLYMFFNAGIQGTARLAQALTTSRKAQVAVGLMAGVAFVMDMVNRAIAGDDDETGRNRYDLIPEFEKSRNWIFMMPGGKYVKVPLPLGFHVFHNAGRLMSDAVNRKDPRNASEYGWTFASTVLDAFNPLGGVASVGQLIAPSVADPLVQIAENKNFMGSAVYKSDDLGFGKTDPKPAYTRHFESTPDLWKGASRMLNDATGGDKDKKGLINVEPDLLRHIYTAMTGGPGRAVDRVLDSSQASARGEPMAASRLPFAGRFYGETDDRQRDRAYYEDAKRVSKAKTEYAFFLKQGRRDLALQVASDLGQGDPAKGRRLIASFDDSQKTAKAISKRLRDLRDDETPDEQQADQLAQLRRKRTQVFSRAVSTE